jgi:hypothetical protein
MIRRDFLKGASVLATSPILTFNPVEGEDLKKPLDDRSYWVNTLSRITLPVLESLATETLKRSMPVEASPGTLDSRKKVTYLEAFGRSIAGLAPWLELGPDTTTEGKLRDKFIKLSVSAIRNGVNPSSPDFFNFTDERQPLVDAAFFAHGLLRAPKQLWGNLDPETQQNVIKALRSTRVIKPYNSNWLLFSATIEAALLKFDHDFDSERIDFGITRHQEWYLGDGVYGDGPEFHFDYYNSFVIQPMLVDIAKTVFAETGKMKDEVDIFTRRAQRYAEIQERLISPEGTFPVVGRSLAYRCGAFQLLAQAALQKQLPTGVSPAQVRGALTAVIKKTMDAPETFDANGWLTIGFCGHQPEVGESYISTGSVYLCSVAFLPLGLPGSDEFWKAPSADWTSRKAFQGKKFKIDKALDEKH